MSISIDSVISEYQVIDVLGMGGMGEVYRAVHTKIGRVAAIKLMGSSDPTFAQRFLKHLAARYQNAGQLLTDVQQIDRGRSPLPEPSPIPFLQKKVELGTPKIGPR